MHSNRLTALVLVAAACASPELCELEGEPMSLPAVLREASGVALSRTYPGILWMHNDSDGGENVFAIDADANLLSTVAVASAQNRDWEDIAIARCPAGGPGGDCLYVADIGDNRAARTGVGLWVLLEPDPRAGDAAADPVFIRLHYPDAARDAEAIAVTDDGTLILMTKGREHPVAVYRAGPLRWPADSSATPVELEWVQDLTKAPVDLPDQITGASLLPGGTSLALRSYAWLQFYRIGSSGLEALAAEPFALAPLGEPQGEGVAVGLGGETYLVSEAGPQGIAPRLTRLRCRVG